MALEVDGHGVVETNDQAVYVFSVPSGFFKVGISNDVPKRRMILQTGCFEPISIFGATFVVSDGTGFDALHYERLIQKGLSEYRTCGEWFHASEEIVVQALTAALEELKKPRAKYSRWSVGTKTPVLPLARETGLTLEEHPEESGLGDCPICTARRATKAAAQYRWRHKVSSGRPLNSQRHLALTNIKPWIGEGMSRTTWYRRRAETQQE